MGHVFEELRNELLGFLTSRLASREEAEDVLHQAFLRALSAAENGHVLQNPRAWLFQVAKHVSVDVSRYKASQRRLTERLVEHGEVEAPVSEAGAVPSEELSELLSRALPQMIDSAPELYRQALRRVELDGASLAEVARELRLSLPALKSRVQRGRAYLKKEFLLCCEFQRDGRGKPVACRPRNPKAHSQCGACSDEVCGK